MPGRPPIPIQTHILEKGKLYNDLAARREVEPQSELEPRMPPGFGREEKRAWKYYKAILREYGLFKIANAPLLEMLARLQAEVYQLNDQCQNKIVIPRDVIEKLDADGNVISRKGKGYQLNPFWKARCQNETQIIGILRELGLSSLGMAKIGSLAVRKKKERDELEGLLD